jgi:4-amino-4-deoxy-L-arabinose transferase-like glycosyltransferase
MIRKTLYKTYHYIILVVLSGFLNIYSLWNLAYGNEYYAAAIKNMLLNFSNFFFLSFDSVGFISVDKAPLSLWVDAIFAKILGFSGFSILLPHAIEGILVSCLVYKIAQKSLGKISAFIAALIVTLSPVNVAVYRNNTPDALLLVFILLSLYFIQRFFAQQQRKYLILSALMLGLGFNTKMLQAFLILPALIAVILIYYKGNWRTKIKHLGIFLVITFLVSFSWITIVDLTSPTYRPYVGSSISNSAWDLAFNYNGAQRFTGNASVGGTAGFNIGDVGNTRLFEGEIGSQAGWLLISAICFSIYYLIQNHTTLWEGFFQRHKHTPKTEPIILVSIGLLFTEFIFFSYANFFHSYYLNILVLPIAFIIGALLKELFREQSKYKLLVLLLGLSLPIQIHLVDQANYAIFMIPLLAIIGIYTIPTVILAKTYNYRLIATTILLIALLVTPGIWSIYTTFENNTASAIFVGGPELPLGDNASIPIGDKSQPLYPTNRAIHRTNINLDLVNYLNRHNTQEKFAIGVLSANEAAQFILHYNTNNVMTIGGFSGNDKAISLETLKSKIANAEIRFFILNWEQLNPASPNQANADILFHIRKNCKSVMNFSGLYDCKHLDLRML